MPIYADQLVRGRGKYRARLVIAGWPYIFVSHRSLVRTLGDGREQIVGLLPESIRIAARADLWRAGLREQEMSIELGDVRSGTVDASITRALYRTPTLTTWLQADVTAAATTIPVSSVDGFPTAADPAEERVIHIGTEAIAYAAVANPGASGFPEFTGCTRGIWNTTALAHFIGDGDRLSYPAVTDLPTVLRDRRSLLYIYGSGDPSSADGHLRWRGVARTDISDEGLRYTIGIEPRSRVLEQQIGGELEEPAPIRGVYLPSSAALHARIVRSATASPGSAFAEGMDLRAVGFWADNDVLTDELTTSLLAGTAGWGWDAAGGAELRAEPLGAGSYRFVYRTGSTTAHWVSILGWPAADGRVGISPVDLFRDERRGTGASGGNWIDDEGIPVADGASLGTGRVYTMIVDAPVPRAYLGAAPDFAHPTSSAFPGNRVYLGGGIAPSTEMAAVIAPNGDDEIGTFAEVDAVDTTDRYIGLGSIEPLFGLRPEGALGPQTRVRLLRVLARGHVGNLIDALIAQSPGITMTGAMPLLTSDDFDTDWSEVEDAIADLDLGADRVFVVSEGISLGELLEHELRLIGCYLALDAAGKLKIKRLGLATATTIATVHLDASKIKGGLPRTTRNPDGLLKEVLIRQGWDPAERKHRGVTIRVRGTTASPYGGVLEIAPRSKSGSLVWTADDPVEVQPDAARLLQETTLGFFGGAYSIVSLEVGLESFEVELGAALLLTSPRVPNADGSRGVAQRVCQLTGYDWSPWEGKGSFELMTHDRRIAGYAPAALITSAVNTIDNTWELTVSIAAYTSGAVTDWFAVGDEIRVVERDTPTPTRRSGTVTAVTATTITVDIDGPPATGAWAGPASGTGEWHVGYDRAPEVDTAAPSGRRWAQTAFCYCAGATRRVGFAGGGAPASEFAP